MAANINIFIFLLLALFTGLTVSKGADEFTEAEVESGLRRAEDVSEKIANFLRDPSVTEDEKVGSPSSNAKMYSKV